MDLDFVAGSRAALSTMESEGKKEYGPAVALLGCGIFARDTYVPIIKAVHPEHLFLSCIWSRSQPAATQLLEIVREFAPTAEAKWGEDGLREILASQEIQCCLLVLPAESQEDSHSFEFVECVGTKPSIVVQALRAGKHVLQEKPVAGTVSAGLNTCIAYREMMATESGKAPIWAVAENYRFERAFYEAGKLVRTLGTVVVVEVIVESQMLRGNKYFDSKWRRELKGGFMTDCGVHYAAGLRVMTGGDVASVSALATHRNKILQSPDNLTALLLFHDGCSGVMVISFGAPVNKAIWRVVCSQGTVEVERAKHEGKFGYTVTLFPLDGKAETKFYTFNGIEDEIKSFARDVQTRASGVVDAVPDQRSSPAQAIMDLAIIEAALTSGLNQGERISIQVPEILHQIS